MARAKFAERDVSAAKVDLCALIVAFGDVSDAPPTHASGRPWAQRPPRAARWKLPLDRAPDLGYPRPMTRAKIQTILFDLDGTIIDTEPSAARAILDCFEAWGVKVDAADSHYITGRTWESAFTFLFKKYPIGIELPSAASEILRRYREEIERELHIVPGSVDAVRRLAERYPMALVSGSNRSEILWALNRLGILDHFKFVLGAEDYPRSKPAPDGYLLAIEKLRARPSSTLIFEDSEAGIASGLAAGARVVAITGTNHFSQDVGSAHHQIPDLREVTAAWVETLD